MIPYMLKIFLKTCSMAHLLSNNLSGMYGVYHDLFNKHYNIYKTHFLTDNETMVQLLLKAFKLDFPMLLKIMLNKVHMYKQGDFNYIY